MAGATLSRRLATLVHNARMTLLNTPLARGCALALLLWPAAAVHAQDKTVYRCPGPPVLYTDAMTPQEAKDKGCRPIEGVPVTVVPAPPRPRAAAPATGASARPGEGRVDPTEQRARDSDAKRILADELKREEDRLAEMKREFNDGEPERRGDERNYAKYQERVAGMRAAIQRKEADIAALKRELAKLPS